MKKTKDFDVFRAQLVLPEHRQMFDYWMECCAGRVMPGRCDINPVRIAKLLPGVSIVDVAEHLPHSKYRLAGTRLREIHDREITGQTLEDIGLGDKHDYWMAAYRRTVHELVPTQGVLKGPRQHKEHMVQYWLRLPLGQNEGKAQMVLGHDHFEVATERFERARQIA